MSIWNYLHDIKPTKTLNLDFFDKKTCDQNQILEQKIYTTIKTVHHVTEWEDEENAFVVIVKTETFAVYARNKKYYIDEVLFNIDKQEIKFPRSGLFCVLSDALVI